MSKHDAHCIAAYQDIFTRHAARDTAPTMHILDNKASTALKHAIMSNKCTFQLVPPHVHRRNVAERAIQTFRDHFLEVLVGVAPTFPKHRWDLLLVHTPCRLIGTTSSDPITSTPHQWALLAAGSSSTAKPCFDNHGTTTAMLATMALPYNIIGAIEPSTKPLERQLSVTQSNFAITISRSPQLHLRANCSMLCKQSTALFCIPHTSLLMTNSPPSKCCKTSSTPTNSLSHLQGWAHLQGCTLNLHG